MRTASILTILVILICGCTKETNSERVVKLTKVEGYEINYEPISKALFEEMFQPGWYCSSIHDVYPNGHLGENYLTMRGSNNGGSVGPNRFSICGKNQLKIYSFYEDYAGDHYQYRLATYSYSEEGNHLSFEGFYSVYYSNPGVYASLTEGCVTSLTETQMDLVTPLWKYGGYAAENAVYTLFRFERLTEEEVSRLNSLYTESR